MATEAREKALASKADPVPACEVASSKDETADGRIFTQDEYRLATLGYKQEFLRSLGLFESWAATFTYDGALGGRFLQLT